MFDSPTSASSSSPLVLVVLLNWHTPAQTAEAAHAVLAMDYPNLRVLLIDNGSTDNSAALLAPLANERSGRVEFLETGANLGFTGGSNRGFERALELGADFVWLLNSDTTTAPTTLGSLVRLAQTDPRIGMVSPRIAPDPAAGGFCFLTGVYDRPTRTLDQTGDPVIAAEWARQYPHGTVLLGTALLIRTELIRRIGPLDESLFMYYEDSDYSVRAIEAGFRNVVDEHSVVFHPEKTIHTDPGAVGPHYWYYMSRNDLRFWRKHIGLARALKLWWWTTLRYLRYTRRHTLPPAAQRAIFAGLWHGALNRSGPYNPSYRMPAPIAAALTSYARRLPGPSTDSVQAAE